MSSRRVKPSITVDEATDRVAELMSVLIGQAILFNEHVARTAGISAVDLQTFGFITRHDGPITPTEVAAQTGLPASTTTRVLDRLEQAGYIVRRGIPTDRRKVAVELVPEKAAEIARHYDAKIDQLRELNAERTPAELAAVISYLDELAEREQA